jgi:DNA invertase Pin-like site-specific DNA recombinase
MRIGYVWVSPDEQSADEQRQALIAAGCDEIFEDRGVLGVSWRRRPRRALARAIAAMEAGDVLVVWKLGPLGLNLRFLVNIVTDLKARGAGLKVLEGNGADIDSTTPNGRLVFGIFAALAEAEHDLIARRTRAGVLAARRRGAQMRPPRKLSEEQVEQAQELVASGQTQAEVAALFGVSPSTVGRALRRLREEGSEH